MPWLVIEFNLEKNISPLALSLQDTIAPPLTKSVLVDIPLVTVWLCIQEKDDSFLDFHHGRIQIAANDEWVHSSSICKKSVVNLVDDECIDPPQSIDAAITHCQVTLTNLGHFTAHGKVTSR